MKTKRLYLMMLIATLGMYAVISFGLTLLQNYANSNIVLYVSVLPEILTVLIELSEITLFSFAFSLMAYAVYLNYPISSRLCLVAILSGAVFFRRIFDLAVILLVYRVLEITDLIEATTYFFLDLLLIWAVFGLIGICAHQYARKQALSDRGTTLFSDENTGKTDLSSFYPYKKIYSKENPIQTCLLSIGILLSAVKVISRVIFDIDYGAPEGIGEILTMAVYYGSDLLIGVIFYALSSLILGRLLRKAL